MSPDPPDLVDRRRVAEWLRQRAEVARQEAITATEAGVGWALAMGRWEALSDAAAELMMLEGRDP